MTVTDKTKYCHRPHLSKALSPHTLTHQTLIHYRRLILSNDKLRLAASSPPALIIQHNTSEQHASDYITKLKIRSVERGICPIATSNNERTVIIIMAGCIAHEREGFISTISFKTWNFRQFGHKWALYCIFFIAHARNIRISTSGLKSDITIVFLDPDFRQDA